MKRNEILCSYGSDYKTMTIGLLEKSGLCSMIPSAKARIAIKPNLVLPSPAELGATTHAQIIAGIIEYLHSHDFENLRIIEGSWVGDKTSEAFEYCGYRTLAEKYSVSLVDTQKDSSYKSSKNGYELNICSSVKDIDFLINVPVLKGHCQTKLTCALKNLKGLIPNSEKRRFHSLGLHKPIALLNSVIAQDFIVVDHICGDLDFEEGGNPVRCDCIMAAVDPVLVDAYACSLLGYSLSDVPYIEEAEKLNIGSSDLSKLELIDLEGSPVCSALSTEKVLNVSYAVEDVDSCSACYASLIPALIRLKNEGLLDRLDEKLCIGQGYRGKTGVLGIGSCTRLFDHSIPGCPPDTERIYEKLKEYILL